MRTGIKIIGFVGSPRKGGNTDVLVRRALPGAEDTGAATGPVYLTTSPSATARGAASAGAPKVQAQRRHAGTLRRPSESRTGSPVSFGMMTGTVKSFVDRWYALLNDDFTARLPPGKTVALILPQGDANPGVFAPMATHFSTSLEFFGLLATRRKTEN